MKQLEGEVLEALADLGGQEVLRSLGGHTVDPKQFLGLEINPRAAAIAELVLWIGYLQWHFRTKGGTPEQPILQQFKNIQHADALVMWDSFPLPKFSKGKEEYPNVRRTIWPEAEYIVGNPPFIGNKRLRNRLGTSYVDVLRAAYPEIPGSVDYVMYWWYRCAQLLKQKKLRKFGLVVTNSIVQPLNRPGLEFLLEDEPLCSITMAIPDHPWVDSEKGAAIRVAIISAEHGEKPGRLVEIVTKTEKRDNSPVLDYRSVDGKINPKLSIGVDVSKAKALLANRSVSQQGVILVGEGFRVTPSEREYLLERDSTLSAVLRRYLIGNDLTDIAQERYVIDVNELSEESIRQRYPHIYQLLLERVQPERVKNDDKAFKEFWWKWGRRRPEISDLISGQDFYVATCRTARHRFFLMLPTSIVPDAKIIFIGLGDHYGLGILSSSVHVKWSLKAGAWLGAGNDSNYNHSDCFEPFPFPRHGELLRQKISHLAEQLESHRKSRQQEHPDLTLTQMYNVLEKLKAGDALDENDEEIKNKGLVLILKELHEKLDSAVFEAYGWPETLTDEQILEKLVTLNHERAEEEKRGFVRWLRPDYQIPRFGKQADKMAANEEGAQATIFGDVPEERGKKSSFPADAVEQTAAVFAALAATSGPADVAKIAEHFRKSKNLEKQIGAVLASLARLGHIATKDGKHFEIRRVA